MNGDSLLQVAKQTIASARFLICCHVIVLSIIFQSGVSISQESTRANSAVLNLANGDSISGEVGASESASVIRWQGWGFEEPFDFDASLVKSIQFPHDRLPAIEGLGSEREFVVDLNNGDVVIGQLIQWDDGEVTVGSKHVGKVRIPSQAIHRISRIQENAPMVFASLAGLQDWKTTSWDTSGWSEIGDWLTTQRSGTALNGDLRVPKRSVVEFELSWKGIPDFVFAIGVDASDKKDSSTDGWRFETARHNLGILRKQHSDSDLDFVADLTNQSSVRLIAYVDQESGQMEVFRPDGTSIGGIKVPGDSSGKGPFGSGVRLINRGSNLTLERLRISSWSGGMPPKIKKRRSSIAMSDGQLHFGEVQKMDPRTKELTVGDEDETTVVPLDGVAVVAMGSRQSDSEMAQCAVFLRDGTRISGELVRGDEQVWVVHGQLFDQVVSVPSAQVRAVIIFRRSISFASDDQAGRRGRLELGSHRLSGHLVGSTTKDVSKEAEYCLLWKPLGSENASRLLPSATGRIVYRDPPRQGNSSTAARALAMQRLRLQQTKQEIDLEESLLQRVDQAKSKSTSKTGARDSHVVHVRTGDVIACRVDRIDEQGVRLLAINSDAQFIPHDQIKAIEFAANAISPDLDAAKRERLLTIPRLQKSAPPTHLLCSQNGDFLRCRLLRMDLEKLVVGVQLGEVEIPRERVSQLIWFHPKDLKIKQPNNTSLFAGKETAKQFEGMAQLLLRDGKRVTFRPQGVDGKFVEGEGVYLGECRFEIDQIDQLIFGVRIAAEVANFGYNRWKLRPAIEPLVAHGVADTIPGSDSPLVGKEAPEIGLPMLGGDEFRLSEHRGKIVVLNFWASWCAPCMTTMPLVEKAVRELESEHVEFVSINLEESTDQIQRSLERHNLDVKVLMDADGVVAARYEARAVPQIVIIGANGKVARLFVGGGTSVVEQLKDAIRALLKATSSSFELNSPANRCD